MDHVKFFGLALVALLIGGCAGTRQAGTLEGKVSIGPLCPVEPCNLPPEQVSKAYTSRNITILAEDMATVVAQEPLGADGGYRVELPAGTYYVTVRPGGIGGQPYPQKTVILANQTTGLNISVDTGIR